MLRVSAFLLMCAAAPVLAESSYLCTSKKEVGFSYNDKTGSYESGVFQANQFLFKPLEAGDKTGPEVYGVYETTGGTLLFRCQRWHPEVGVAHCGNGNDYHFKLGHTSENKARFVSADLGVLYTVGYETAAPRIGIGECIKL